MAEEGIAWRIRLRKGSVPYGDFIGWVHCVNIVTFPNGEKYSCDVGFGGDGPTHPLPLISGAIGTNLGTQEVRLIHDYFPNAPEPKSVQPKFWFYQYRNGPDLDWNTYYGFPEMQFGDHDLEMMNYWTSQSSDSFQRRQVLVVKFLLDEEEGEGTKIKGKIMLGDGFVKRNMGGKTQLVMECTSEKQRVGALKELFGIELTEDQRTGIRGTITDLDSVKAQ
ncbi:N-terminal acetyltransferase [Rhizophlyctis rosea]|nr:N-terminal acetyltransferase [Rhizophlyctis rosea]